MRIAVFHNTAQVGCARCCSEGMVTTLASLGHEVLNLGNPCITSVPLEVLRTVDLIISGGPEWFAGALLARYGQHWFDLRAVKAAWYAETALRDDRSFDFAGLRPLADLHYYPAVQDAEQFGGTWLPFGADTLLFSPPADGVRTFQTGFLGTIYPKRLEYLRATGFPITVLPPVHDADPVRSTHMLAEAYRSVEIFVNLPAYSRLLVTKITEVMACRAMLVTPAVDHPSGVGNMRQFEDGKHLVYYDQDRPDELAKLLDHYAHAPEERARIAQAGCEEVHRSHTLRNRMGRILEDAERRGNAPRQAGPS